MTESVSNRFMLCPTRERLMSEYSDKVRSFEQCVERMRDLSGGDFVRIYKESEALRDKCESARQRLEEHVAEHHCGAPEAASGMHAALV